MKKRACENNKSIRLIKKQIKLLRKENPNINISLDFKGGRGSHVFEATISSDFLDRTFTVCKKNTSTNYNLNFTSFAMKCIDDSLLLELRSLLRRVWPSLSYDL